MIGLAAVTLSNRPIRTQPILTHPITTRAIGGRARRAGPFERLSRDREQRSARPLARPVSEFLDSLGVNSAVHVRGEEFQQTVACANYLGIRWFRAGYESGVQIEKLIELHKRTGVKISYGLASGGSDFERLLGGGRELAKAGALLAFEGNNEPNNWPVLYGGEKGGGDGSWLAIARLQRDLYSRVKADPLLRSYPVWSTSEGGAQTDNVGLQFLTIPKGAKTLMPVGTRYADAANVHNYIYHPNSPLPADNKTWNAADPGPECRVDGLFGEYGVTWAKHYPGYSERELRGLPRVTTETGCAIDANIDEDRHGKDLLMMYLAQFARGWSHTAMYLLRDRVDEGGNQKFGFYAPDYSPRKAAVYLHNLTTALGPKENLGRALSGGRAAQFSYSISPRPATLHEMPLVRNDGTRVLIVWNERVKGSDEVTIELPGSAKRITYFDPIRSERPQAELSTPRVRISLSDHPIVLTFRI